METKTKTCTHDKEQILTCRLCGHAGLDVIIRYEHVGGRGDIPIVQCANRPQCWQRYDNQYKEVHYNA